MTGGDLWLIACVLITILAPVVAILNESRSRWFWPVCSVFLVASAIYLFVFVWTLMGFADRSLQRGRV